MFLPIIYSFIFFLNSAKILRKAVAESLKIFSADTDFPAVLHNAYTALF